MKGIKQSLLGMMAIMLSFGCGEQEVVPYSTTFSSNSLSWEPAAGLMRIENQNQIQKKVIVENEDTIVIEYSVPEPYFEATEDQLYNGEKTEKCILGNAWVSADPGEPLTPYISSRIILPFGRTIKRVIVIPRKTRVFAKEVLLGYGEIIQPISSKTVVRTQADPIIYESNQLYPKYRKKLLGIEDRCGVKIATINVYPLHYYPADRKVEYYKTFRLRIKTKEISVKNLEATGNGIRTRLDRFSNHAMTEENPGTLNTYQNGLLGDATDSPLAGALAEYKYVIVTNQSIINANTTPNLDDFVAHKTAMGFSCKVKDIAEVLSEYPGTANSDKLRNFLRDAYNNWNTEYVLLGGDTNIIPLRTVYDSRNGHSDYLPSDLPYQCLSQATWNNDFEAELYIGRASAENATEFSNFVYKTIAYETTGSNDPYLKNVLHLGERLDSNTYGKTAMKAIQNKFSSDFSFDGLYDQDGTWSKSQLISKVNSNNFSIINHLGHSNAKYVMKLYINYVFKNNKFIFAKSQGCIPGAFDKNCIAEEMTTSDRNGMWGVVFNSRYGWYSPGNVVAGSSQKVHMSFWDAYFNKKLKRVGQCNEYSHRVNKSRRWDILESNLFGDPSVVIAGGSSHDTYSLTVVNGKGSDDYTAGSSVQITANTAPSGQVFNRWELTTGNPQVANIYSSSTTLTMPARNATVTATYKNTTPPEEELANGQAISVTLANGDWEHHFISVPAGSSNLVMKISGGSGDADLYTRFGSKPTSSSYDCRPYKNGNEEECTVPTPPAGKYYVSLTGFGDFSNVSLVASYDSGSTPQVDLTVNTSGQGSVNLNPPGGTYDEGSTITLTANPASGWVFTNWSDDLSGSSNPTTITMNTDKSVTAVFKENISGGQLFDDQAVIISGAKGEWKHFYINVPSGAFNFSMRISGGSGNADLYTRFGAQPSIWFFDCRPKKSNNNETCNLLFPKVGKYHVSIRGQSAYSNVRLIASYGGGAVPDDSCKDRCGSQAPSDCWCDVQCDGLGDCCPDKNQYCD